MKHIHVQISEEANAYWRIRAVREGTTKKAEIEQALEKLALRAR